MSADSDPGSLVPRPHEPALPWDPVRHRLAGTRFADVRRTSRTGSTNADVLALARAGEPEGVVIVADHQSAGRGRFDRRWEAPPGSSLLLSILTRPAGVAHLHLVTEAAGVAAAEAARAATGADVRLKWPNDLIVETDAGTRKLSGILAEAVFEREALCALVVGIGLNVTWPTPIPGELAGTAVALNHLTDRDIERESVLVDLLRGFDRWYATVSADGVASLRLRYRQLSATIGRRVQVDTSEGRITGDAVDVDDEGRLLVVDECPDRPRAITAGDVTLVRPAPRRSG